MRVELTIRGCNDVSRSRMLQLQAVWLEVRAGELQPWALRFPCPCCVVISLTAGGLHAHHHTRTASPI
jgi:hypothetical protein